MKLICSSNSIHQKFIRYSLFDFFRVVNIPPNRIGPHRGPWLEKIVQDQSIPERRGKFRPARNRNFRNFAHGTRRKSRISGDSQPEFHSEKTPKAPTDSKSHQLRLQSLGSSYLGNFELEDGIGVIQRPIPQPKSKQ